MSATETQKWAGYLVTKYGIPWPVDENDEE